MRLQIRMDEAPVELKFKVWCHELRKMFGPYTFEEIYDNCLELDLSNYSTKINKSYESLELSVLQYTGFKDKHGEEIYDQDYLRDGYGGEDLVRFDRKKGLWVADCSSECIVQPLCESSHEYSLDLNVFEAT